MIKVGKISNKQWGGGRGSGKFACHKRYTGEILQTEIRRSGSFYKMMILNMMRKVNGCGGGGVILKSHLSKGTLVNSAGQARRQQEFLKKDR